MLFRSPVLLGTALIALSMGLLTWRVTALERWQAEDRGHVETLISHELAEAIELDQVLAIEKRHDVMLAECIRGHSEETLCEKKRE